MKNPLYVVWERRDEFSGEDHPANTYSLPWSLTSAEATDVFNKSIPVKISNGALQIDVTDTPVFIEAVNK